MTTTRVPGLPGGGPLHRRPREAIRPVNRFLAWTVPTLAATTLVVLLVVVRDPIVLGSVPILLVLVLFGVRPAVLDTAAARPDAVERYSDGVRVTLAATRRGAVARVDGRRVGTLTGPTELTEGELHDRPVALVEEPEDGARRLALAGPRRIAAVGHRDGRTVDWTLDLDGTVLRMRRRDGVRVLRRTLLEPATGDAWLVRGDPATGTWEADLPPGLPDEAAVFCLWLVRRLDGLPRVGSTSGGAVPVFVPI